MHRTSSRRGHLVALVVGAAMLAACGTAETPANSPRGGLATPTTPEAQFEADASPAREAVLVAADYRPPKGRVDSTGAYLPANGKPTLVFVDAIW